MNCYNCGRKLSEKDFCTSCGVEVKLYKKIICASNYFYNAGLEKAKVKDISGAIVSLRQSLKFNKDNVEARNLLGLAYYACGEIAPALSEWVISKNIRGKKNIADDYLNTIQNDQAHLELYNQTIKKYNQALVYCEQDSLDLAVIQLKKVLSQNSNFVNAHLLLALLYINEESWDKAEREVERVLLLDCSNTMALRYRSEIQWMQNPADEKSATKKGKNLKEKEDVIQYKSGNETIIQPLNAKEKKSYPTLISLIAGICIGLAVAIFLILPAQLNTAKQDSNEEIKAVGEQLSSKTATVGSLEQQLAAVQEEYVKLQNELGEYVGTDGKLRANDQLLLAATSYLANPFDTKGIADNLDQVEDDFLGTGASDAFIALYDGLMGKVGVEAAATYYQEGYAYFIAENYEEAIPLFTKAYKFNEENSDALYNLANAYNKNGNKENAQLYYEKVIDKFPDKQVARKAEDYLKELASTD